MDVSSGTRRRSQGSHLQGLHPRRSSFRGFHLVLLLLITAFGAVLRLTFLDRPPVWGDEALTFARVCGTFGELLTRLATAGFAPLHYELVWLIGQRYGFSPAVLRITPAIAGTLMVPAMYWLTRELLGPDARHRRLALLVALLTACNAYLLNYSRDAKMYSTFWLFTAVNIAALLAWLRSRGGVMYFLWIASGAAMVGVDSLGYIPLTIELLIVLTAPRAHWRSIPKFLVSFVASIVLWLLTAGPIVAAALLFIGGVPTAWRHWLLLILIPGAVNLLRLLVNLLLRTRMTMDVERSLLRPATRWLNGRFAFPPLLLFLIGLAMIAAGPIGYYLEFNQYISKVDERGWQATGIEWVGPYNQDRTGATLAGYTASAYLTGWEWPREADQSKVEIRTYRLLAGSTIALAALLTLGLLPWRRLGNGAGDGGGRFGRGRFGRGRSGGGQFGGGRSGGQVGRGGRHIDRSMNWVGLAAGHRPFRAALWLTLWLVLPPYGFYCCSVRDHESPSSWLRVSVALIHDHRWTWPVLAGLGGAWLWMAAAHWRQRLINVVQAAAIAFVVLALAQLVYRGYPYLDATLSKRSAGWATHASVWIPRYLGFVLPAFLIVVAVLLSRLPTRPLRWGAIGLLAVVNLSQGAARVFAGSEPPTRLIAQDVLDSQKGWVSEDIRGKETSVATRSFFSSSLQRWSGGGPGDAAMHSTPMRYYLAILSGNPTTEAQIKGRDYRYRALPSPNTWLDFDTAVANDIRRSPTLRRFVTWKRLSPGEVDVTDRVLDLLPRDWRLQSQVDYVGRDHWRWIDQTIDQRRVYMRGD